MKTLVLSLLLGIPFICVAQDNIDIQKARSFFASANQTQVVEMTLSESDGEMYDLYSNKAVGDIIITGEDIRLVKEKRLLTAYNCSVFFFNKEILGAENAIKKRNTILSKYNFGVSFKELADKYATPETSSDDFVFYYESLNEGPLKEALGSHNPGKMFLVEVSNNFSYLIVINSPPAQQNTVILLQPEENVKF